MNKFLWILILFLFPNSALSATSVNSESDPRLDKYLDLFINNGITTIGKNKPFSLIDLKTRLKQYKFKVVSGTFFSKMPQKSRRSAFYVKNENTVYLNEDDPPSPALLLHEIFQDKHYEVSATLSSLYRILNANNSDSWDQKIKIAALKELLDHIVDQYGLNTEVITQWHSDEINTLIAKNSVLLGVDGEGGDVSGGGGDNLAIDVKSRVLNLLLDKLLVLYVQELDSGTIPTDDLQYFLGNTLLKILVYVYLEPQHNDYQIKYLMTKAVFEEIQFIPYLIRIPKTNRTAESLSQEIVNVLLQSDFTLFSSNIENHYVKCKCDTALNRGKRLFFFGICPDKKKMHKAFEEIIDIYYKDHRCSVQSTQ